MPRLFGTDGVRGIANTELSCDLAFKLGQATAYFQGQTILVGKDTRLSSDMLESAVAAGLMSMGTTVLCAGIIPTPAVAYLVRELHCDGGIMISASHNPPEYNGIKIFDSQGFKLSDALEDEIESFVTSGGAVADNVPRGDAVGVLVPVNNACELYIAHAVAAIESQNIRFDGLCVALDAGHGSASLTSAEALRRLGANVVAINDDFNGLDINVACGSTHLDPLRALVAQSGADIGIAHDGDADRVMMLDAHGNEIDGDMMAAVCALDLRERGMLTGNTLVSTLMCNLGLVHAMQNAGIALVQTQVGDRYVLEALLEGGFVLGGEQSGHLIFLEHNSTGDGLMTALQFLAACQRAGKAPDEAVCVMKRFPQVIVNVPVDDKHALESATTVWDAVHAAEAEMGSNGRVIVRPSGTEPVVRIMVETVDYETAACYAHALAQVVERELAQ